MNDFPQCPPDAAHEAWFLSEANPPFLGNVTRRQSRLIWLAARHDADAKIFDLSDRLDKAEDALLRKGYVRNCDIPACNCRDQWNHGGLAEARLREISEALDGRDNGKTLLVAVKELVTQAEESHGEMLTLRGNASGGERCKCHCCIKEKSLVGGELFGHPIPLDLCTMIVCDHCGNKRCPKASDHRYACTGSVAKQRRYLCRRRTDQSVYRAAKPERQATVELNDPGQPGSVYR